VIRLEPEQPDCPECGRRRTVIRVERTEEIDYVPARFIRRIFERPVCACPHCQEHLVQAPPPPRPIDKSRAGAGLLAQIAVSRFCDHLPHYRQGRIFTRHGHMLIDDNPFERGIRPAALGRKNWMFIGHPDAGWRMGVFYTLMANCALAKVDPRAWLRDALRRLPSLTNQDDLSPLLPLNWKHSVKEPDAS